MSDDCVISGFDLLACLAKSSFALLIIYDCFEELIFSEIRPEHMCEVQFGISTLKEQEIGEILERVLQFLTLVTPSSKVDAVKEDPDDNTIIECAVESNS